MLVTVTPADEIVDLSGAPSEPIATATAVATKPNVKDFPERSRRIPVWLRDEVLKRDGYKCNYVNDRGIPCGCPFNLEIDHIVPFARGGMIEKKRPATSSVGSSCDELSRVEFTNCK